MQCVERSLTMYLVKIHFLLCHCVHFLLSFYLCVLSVKMFSSKDQWEIPFWLLSIHDLYRCCKLAALFLCVEVFLLPGLSKQKLFPCLFSLCMVFLWHCYKVPYLFSSINFHFSFTSVWLVGTIIVWAIRRRIGATLRKQKQEWREELREQTRIKSK